mmetsp:Transcript_101055/g.240808  ORF Transcript_101055/g.240808 Transcript_101055/m.240808 type:complete len:876 (-) Transcript_101055:166-2793(-)
MVLPDVAGEEYTSPLPEVLGSSGKGGPGKSERRKLSPPRLPEPSSRQATPERPPAKVHFSEDFSQDGNPENLDAGKAEPKPPSRWQYPSHRSLAAGIYLLLALVLAVWCTIKSINSEGTQWPPPGLLLPLVILSSPGSWAISLPMKLGARSQEPMGRFLAAAAVLPPAVAGQLLLRTAAGAEFSSCVAELAAVLGGMIQFLLLLGVSKPENFPIPMMLSFAIGLGHAVGVGTVSVILEEDVEDTTITGIWLISLFIFIMAGATAQLAWGVSFQSEQTLQTSKALRRLRNSIQEASPQDVELMDGGPMVISHYEETMKQVDAIWDALRYRPTLSEEVIFELGTAFHNVKGTLTSGKLYKTEVKGGLSLPPALPLMSSISESSQHNSQQLQYFRQVQSALDSERVEHIRQRGSSQSHSDDVEGVDLPHTIPGHSKTAPRGARSARSSVSIAADEQLQFLAQLHAGCHNDLTENELPEPMDKREATLAELGRWKFDAYAFERHHGNALLHAGFRIGSELLTEAGVTNFALPLRCFLQDLQRQYHTVPYHNYIHAADVLSSCTYFLSQDRRVSRAPLPALPRLATFVAAVIHDVGHFGRSNRYHVASHDPVAVLYNDQSPLENMHCTIGFSLLRQPQAALFRRPHMAMAEEDGCSGLPDADFTLLRRIVIEAVLATDMSKHFETLSRFKAAINYTESGDKNDISMPSEPSIYTESAADRAVRVVSVYLKAADIGHAGKPLDITRRMTIRIHMEFFSQGDEERELGLPISPLCDRNEVNIAISQVGFLRHLVTPLYKAVHFYITSDDFLIDCLNRLEANLNHWQSAEPCVTTQDVPDTHIEGIESVSPAIFSPGVFPQSQIVNLITGCDVAREQCAPGNF